MGSREEKERYHPTPGMTWIFCCFHETLYININFKPCVPLVSVAMPTVCHNKHEEKNAVFWIHKSWHCMLANLPECFEICFLLSCGINWHEHETATGLRSPEMESNQMGTESEWFFSLAQKLMHKFKYENEKFELLALPSFLSGCSPSKHGSLNCLHRSCYC